MLNIKYLTTGPGEINNDEDLKEFYKEISILGEYAEEKNVYICLETCGSFFNSGKTASKIIKKINMKNIRINYDTLNVIRESGGLPEEDIKYVLPFLEHIHLKDTTDSSEIKLGYSGIVKMQSNSSAIGKGIVNFEKFFSILEDFEGPMSIELEFSNKETQKLENVVLMLKESYNFLRNLGVL